MSQSPLNQTARFAIVSLAIGLFAFMEYGALQQFTHNLDQLHAIEKLSQDYHALTQEVHQLYWQQQDLPSKKEPSESHLTQSQEHMVLLRRHVAETLQHQLPTQTLERHWPAVHEHLSQQMMAAAAPPGFPDNPSTTIYSQHALSTPSGIALWRALHERINQAEKDLSQAVEFVFTVTIVGIMGTLLLMIHLFYSLSQESHLRILAEREYAVLNEELESRLSATFEQAAFGIAHMNEAGQWIRVNHKFGHILGMDKPTLLDTPLLTLNDGQSRHNLKQAMEDMIAGHLDTYETEKQYTPANATSPIWVHETWSPIRHQNGSFRYFMVVLENVHRRKTAEMANLETQSKYRRIVESNMVGIFFFNLDGRISYANDAFLQMLGYEQPYSEAWQLSWKDLTPEPLQEQDQRLTDVIIRDGVVPPFEKQFFHRHGHKVDVLIGAALFEHSQEEGVAFVMNMTDQKRLQQQLIYTNQELESFSYSISHDLKAPLRRVEQFVQLLESRYTDRLDESGQSLIQRTVNNVEDMRTLIDDLLKFSRISRSDIHRQSINLTEMAESIAMDLVEQEPERHVKFNIAEGMTASCDPVLMKTVLENLIGNAWKFTSKTDNPVIDIGMMNLDGETTYFVRDNGAGFESQLAERLFKPFQRLHQQEEFPGHGIGLANVKRIIHRHAGEIWASGSTGKGATFYFTLPPEPYGIPLLHPTRPSMAQETS